MASIASTARITRKGRVQGSNALIAATKHECAAPTCTNQVQVAGNFCSVSCAVAPVIAVQTPVQEPLSPVAAYFQACQRADWLHDYSDDAVVWKRGRAQIAALKEKAATDPTFQAIYDAWHQYAFSSANQAVPTLDQFTKETPVPKPDHIAPCPDMLKGCIDLECQVRKGIRERLLTNFSEADRPKWSQALITVLERLLNNAEYGHEGPDFFIEACFEAAMHMVLTPDEAQADIDRIDARTRAHVQAPKAVLTTTTQAVRRPRTAKTPPRTTDNKEHPVTERITMTKDEMARAIAQAVETQVAQRIAEIRAAEATAPEHKPVEIVSNKGGRAKVQRITAQEREFAGCTLPAIVVNDALTIPALEVGEEIVDTLATPKARSPYNKARFRLDANPVALDKDATTYRALIAEHLRITALVAAKTPKAAPKAVTASIDPAKAAKATKKAKIAALMEVMGCTKAEAKAIIG